MKLISVEELWNFALALAREMNKEALFEADQLARQASPILKAKLKRLNDQIGEFAEAGSSRRDALALLADPWRREGFSFPASEKECEEVARAYSIMLNFALTKMLRTSRRELGPLVAEAFRRKQNTFDEYAAILDRYYQPAGEWFCRYINHGAGALADFYFGRLRRGGIPFVELAALYLEQAGLDGARRAIDEVVKAEDSQYWALMNEYGQLVDALTAGTKHPSPSSVAELIVASQERMIKHMATFYMELAQPGSKLRQALIERAASSIRENCRKRLAELEDLFGPIECRNEFRRPEIDYDPNKALALDLILTYKRRKKVAEMRRERYQKLAELCEEAGADCKYVEAFGVRLGLLLKRGRPRK